MALPQLFDGSQNDVLRNIRIDAPAANARYRMLIRSPNPNLQRNPAALPINPNQVQEQSMSHTRQDSLNAGGVVSSFGMPRPGTLAISGDSGKRGKFVWERLLDFYGRSKEEFLFYNRDIEISWGGVVYIGSWDTSGYGTSLPTPINGQWNMNFTFFNREGQFTSEVPTLPGQSLDSEFQNLLDGFQTTASETINDFFSGL